LSGAKGGKKPARDYGKRGGEGFEKGFKHTFVCIFTGGGKTLGLAKVLRAGKYIRGYKTGVLDNK